ncbi:MAG: tetratricopeptide repeat protein [Bacteroidetes bacterium]|nr:tetratricopeptide repeat protein [Bacteroidota bacterium]
MRTHFVLVLVTILLMNSCSGPVSRRDTAWTADTAAVNRMNDKISLREITNPDSAMNVVLRATALARKIDYPAGLAWALFEHGNLLYQENRYNEAIEKYTAVLKMAKQMHMTLLSADCLERMASVHLATDDPSLALKLYYDALVLYEKIPDSLGIAKVYNILGIYKTDTKEYDSAKVYFGKAIAINEHKNQQYPLIENRGNLAWMHEKMGDFKKAEQIFNEIVVELTGMKDSLSLPTTYFNLATLYQEKKKFDTTLIFLDKALRIAEPVKDTILLSSLYGNKGEIFFKMGKYDSASWYLKKSITCSGAIDDVETEAQALSWLLKVDSVTGDFKKAFETGKRIFVLNDSGFHRKLRSELKTSELRYENEHRKVAMELQRQRIETAGRERKLFMILFILSIAAGALIGLVLVLERKNNRKNKQINQNSLMINDLRVDKILKNQEVDRLKMEQVETELKSRERELVCNALMIEQKNEFLNDINKKIQDLYLEQPDVAKAKIVNELITSIKLQLNKSGEADLFNQQFAVVHEKFYADLKKAHPGLTRSEIKFCAYLRLNLSGTQISNSLNVTPEAIKKTRYRIRKKLSLSPECSLEDYISGF